MAFVTEIMGFIDTAILGAAENSFGAVAGSFGGMVTVVTTLLVVMFGVAISMGIYAVRTGDVFQLILRIVLIFTFGLSWTNFSVIYDALTNASGGLVAALFSVAGNGAANATELADNFAQDAQGAAASVIRAESSITRGVLGVVMYALLAGLQAAYILVAGFAKMMIGILVGVAPFAIATTAFHRTQFLFEAWLSALISYFMYPVAAAGVMGFVATVAKEAFSVRDESTLLGITGVVTIIIVGIFALKSIPQIASNITGQLNLGGIAPEALSIVARPAVQAGQISRGAGAQVLSGATTGGETAQRAAQNRRFGSKTDMKLANAGAALANNRVGHFIQRRRDLNAARAANERRRQKL